MTLVGLWRRFARYFAHPDPRVALGGTVAMIVVSNQPFYPFYVWYAAGMLVPAAFLTWLSMPVFAAAPALARRTPTLGRTVLLAAAVGNTILSTLALGTGSAVELFYLPSGLLAWAMFAPGVRLVPMAASVAAIIAGLMLARLAGPPIAALSAAQQHALAAMHAVSVACLTAIIAFQAWRLSAAAPVSRTGP